MRSKSPRSPIFHHISPEPRIKTGVDSTYASKTESYVLSTNHCRPRFVESQSSRLIRTYDRTYPLPSLLTTSFQTFVSPDSSGSSGRKMIVYRANVGIAARSCTIYRSSLPFIEMCVPVREGALLSVAVDFYHRFRPP